MSQKAPLLSALLAAAVFAGEARADQRQPVVVELFTSQGCSSCPPADELLGEMATRGDVIALSFNVDIWDYLGWQDSLARPGHAKRQAAYASRMPNRQVYTPQAIVDGALDVVGSRRGALEAAIAERRGAAHPSPRISLALDGDVLVAEIGAAPVPANEEATIWLVRKAAAETIDIDGGENSGRTITYTNVVRDMDAVGMWSGTPTTLRLPAVDAEAVDATGYVLLVQEDGTGEIWAAAALDGTATD